MARANLLPPVLWQSVPFGDPDARADWKLHHGIWHQVLAQITKAPFFNFDDLEVELVRHAEIHDFNSDALKISRPVDLTSFDLRDRSSWYSFMVTHAQQHARENAAAGI